LEEFSEKWDSKYPIIAKSRRANWSRIRAMFSFPQEIRRAIYTTNVIESLNFSLRKITKTRAALPNEDAALKLLYLGLQNAAKKWTFGDSELKFSNESIGNYFSREGCRFRD
jgi:transposase-like protein